MTTNVEHRRFEPFLKRSRKVTMVRRDFFVFLPPRSEMLFEEATSRSVVVPFFASSIQAQCRNTNRAIRPELHSLFKKFSVPSGIPVGRQTHDFVFVAVEIKSEMKRD